MPFERLLYVNFVITERCERGTENACLTTSGRLAGNNLRPAKPPSRARTTSWLLMDAEFHFHAYCIIFIVLPCSYRSRLRRSLDDGG